MYVAALGHFRCPTYLKRNCDDDPRCVVVGTFVYFGTTVTDGQYRRPWIDAGTAMKEDPIESNHEEVVEGVDDLNLSSVLRGIYSYGSVKSSATQQRVIKPILDCFDTIV